MRKVILEEWVTLDGYAADKDGNLDFPSSDTDKFSDRDQLEFLDTADTILLSTLGELAARACRRRRTDDVSRPRRLANLQRVGVRTYDTGAVFLHYEPLRNATG